MHKVLFFLLALLTSYPLTAQNWFPLGAQEDNLPTINAVPFFGLGACISSDNKVYIAYHDVLLRKGFVRMYDGANWSYVGSSGFSVAGVKDCSILMHADTLFVSFVDSNNSQKVTVRKYDGTDWIDVGPAVSVANCASPVMAFDNAGDPYVLFTESQSSLTLKKFNGSDWVYKGLRKFAAVTAPGNSPGTFYWGACLGFDAANTPFAMYKSDFGQISVQKLVGNAWTQVDSLSLPNTLTNAIMKFNNGVPYLACANGSITRDISLKMLSGNTWTNVGSIVTTGDYYNIVGLDFTGGNLPFLTLFLPVGSETNLLAKTYDGTAWQDFAAPVPSTNPQYFSLLGTTGIHYLVYRDVSRNSKVSVSMQTNNSTGVEFAGAADVNSIADQILDTAGVPYIVSNSASEFNGQAVVRKFNNGIWEIVGGGSASASTAELTKMAIDKNNSIYIAYKNLNNKITVRKFNGTSWATIGSEAFATGTVLHLDIDVDTSGMPYVAYIDYTSASSANLRVKRYFGGQWVFVGGTFIGTTFNTSSAIPCHITVDKSGEVYVVNKFVNKLVGGAWTQLGVLNVGNTKQGVVVDGSGVPYILAATSPTKAYKYISGNWAVVGPNIMSASSDYGNLVLDSGTVPYVIISNGGHAEVRKFTGSSWDLVDNVLSQGLTSFGRLNGVTAHLLLLSTHRTSFLKRFTRA